MSLQLVLSHYLASLRERDELDALWPEVLKAMGHEVLSRPQIGVAQAGVDILSIGAEADGSRVLYLWILKFGDVGREDFYAGTQAIQPSVREAYTDFIPHRLTPEQLALPKRIVVLSNGQLKQEVRAGFSGLAAEVSQKPGVTLDFWGMDQVAPLIEAHVFDETLLIANGRSDLRAAVASFDDTDEVVRRFLRFTEDCLVGKANDADVTPATRLRRFLKRAAAAAMGHAVLLVLGAVEKNLKPGVIAGEYLLLRLWAEASQLGVLREAEFLTRLTAIRDVYLHAQLEYAEKVLPALREPALIARYRPNVVFYAQLVFEELGRIAALGLWLHHHEGQIEIRRALSSALRAIFDTHSISFRPVFDHQSIDLSLAFGALIANGENEYAKAVLRNAVEALRFALARNEPLPVDSDLLDDAIAEHVTGESGDRQFFQNSTLIPMLATVAASLDDEPTLARLRELEPKLESVTLERWFPAQAFETYTGSSHEATAIGISRGLERLAETTAAERLAAESVPFGAAVPDSFAWNGTPWESLLPVAARLHRLPVAPWYLVRLAQAREPQL